MPRYFEACRVGACNCLILFVSSEQARFIDHPRTKVETRASLRTQTPSRCPPLPARNSENDEPSGLLDASWMGEVQSRPLAEIAVFAKAVGLTLQYPPGAFQVLHSPLTYQDRKFRELPPPLQGDWSPSRHSRQKSRGHVRPAPWRFLGDSGRSVENGVDTVNRTGWDGFGLRDK